MRNNQQQSLVPSTELIRIRNQSNRSKHKKSSDDVTRDIEKTKQEYL